MLGDESIVVQIPHTHMKNPRYSLIVRAYLMGQFRIQLTDLEHQDSFAPPGHGVILRELCTYHIQTMWWVLSHIAAADDPKQYVCGYENEKNCEHPGVGRIRLDQ